MEKDDEKQSRITLLNKEQVMKYLNVSQTIFYKLVNSGTLPSVRLGTRLLVRRSSLEKYLERVETKKRASHGSWFC